MQSECLLAWRIHLARRTPQRLPVLLLAIAAAAACVWLMFQVWLPVAVAVLLLVGATREYLFPTEYRLTAEGVAIHGPLLRLELAWKDVKRLLPEPGGNGALLSPLAMPSRLDAFRGVRLLFAPAGCPGDRESVEAILRQCAPQLFVTPQERS